MNTIKFFTQAYRAGWDAHKSGKYLKMRKAIKHFEFEDEDLKEDFSSGWFARKKMFKSK